MKRAALAALVVVLGMAWAVPGASAHALLRSSEPGAGEALSSAPAAVTLHFTEQPDPGISVIRVLDSTGRTVGQAPVRPVPGDARALAAPLPGELKHGVYTVDWRATSAVDGHTTVGSFSFGIGETPDATVTQRAPTSRNPSPTAAGIAGRWLLYAGLVLLAGAAAVHLVAPSDATTWPARVIIIAAVMAAAGLAINVADQASVAHAGLGTYLRSRTGRSIRLEIAAASLTFAAALVWRLRPGRVAAAAVAVTAVLAMIARVDAGHAAASSIPWFTVAVQSAHFVAAGAWVGGLPFLVLGLVRTPAGVERVELGRRFSKLATVGLIVVVVTGTTRAVDEVGAWSRLTDAAFGQALLVKLAAVALLIGVGWRNRRRRAEPDRLRRGARVEIGVAVAVLVATAVLTGIAPSSSRGASARPRTPAAAVVVDGSDFATTTRVRLAATPGRAGPNRFVVTITDYDTREPLAALGVALRFQLADRGDVAPSTLALRRAGTRWTGQGLNLSADGRWEITVAIDTVAGGLEVPLELETALPPQRVTAQRTPGLPTIYTVTAATAKVQVYFDPERPGPNQLHLTFLRGDGEEDVAEVSASVDGAEVPTRRLDKGHFVADVDARPRTYRITTTATLTDGTVRRYRLSVPIPS